EVVGLRGELLGRLFIGGEGLGAKMYGSEVTYGRNQCCRARRRNRREVGIHLEHRPAKTRQRQLRNISTELPKQSGTAERRSDLARTIDHAANHCRVIVVGR